jgi:hypothetical protein
MELESSTACALCWGRAGLGYCALTMVLYLCCHRVMSSAFLSSFWPPSWLLPWAWLWSWVWAWAWAWPAHEHPVICMHTNCPSTC